MESLNEARSLWKQVSDYYTLLKDKKPITYIWQALVEMVNELKDKEDAVAITSPENAPEYKKLLWEKFSDLYESVESHTGEVLATSEVLNIFWGDGSYVDDGYWYNQDNRMGGDLTKVNLSTMVHEYADISSQVDFDVFKFLTNIVIRGDYVWMCDARSSPPISDCHIYKINKNTLVVEATYVAFGSLGLYDGGESGCADDEYYYIGGRGADIIKFRFSDGTIYSEVNDGAGEFSGNMSFHCMVQDGDYIYAFSSDTKYMYKILKEDLSIVAKTKQPNDMLASDNIVQDKYYVYTTDEIGANGYINRWRKSDMHLDQILLETLCGSNGGDLILRGELILIDRDSPVDGYYTIAHYNTITGEVTYKALSGESSYLTYSPWSIMIDPDNPEYTYMLVFEKGGSTSVLFRYSTISILCGQCKAYLLNSNIIDIPKMQNGINKSSSTLIEGENYFIINQTLSYISGEKVYDAIGDNRKLLIYPADQEAIHGDISEYWLPETPLKNDIIEDYVNNIFDLDLSDYEYYHTITLLKMLWAVAKNGATEDNLSFLAHGLAGVPMAKYPGTVRIMDTPDRYEIYYYIKVYVIKLANVLCLATDKTTYTGLTLTDNAIIGVASTVKVNDCVVIDGENYRIIEKVGSDALLGGDITDGTYSIDVYSNLDRTLYPNCLLFDDSGGKVYPIDNNNEYPSYMMKMVHQGNIAYDESKPYIKTVMETLYKLSDFPVCVSNGQNVPRFQNMQRAFDIKGWENGYIDTILAEYLPSYKPDGIKTIYCEEIDKVYSPVEDTLEDSNIVVLDGSDKLTTGESVTVKTIISGTQYRITKTYQDDDDYWWITVDDDDYQFKGLEHIIVAWDGDDNTHSGEHAVILEGVYDKVVSAYNLKVDIDMSDILSYLVDGDGNKIVDENGAYIVAFVEAYVHVLKGLTHTREITSMGDPTEYLMNADIPIDMDLLPVVKKAPYTGYGDTVKRVLSTDASAHDNVISVTGDIDGDNKYQYLMIYGDTTGVDIHKIDDISGTTITTEDNLTRNYKVSDNATIILIKSLPTHHKIVFNKVTKYYIVNEEGEFIVNENGVFLVGNIVDEIEGYEKILTEYPEYQNNINKVLDMILPGGYGYVWNI